MCSRGQPIYDIILIIYIYISYINEEKEVLSGLSEIIEWKEKDHYPK